VPDVGRNALSGFMRFLAIYLFLSVFALTNGAAEPKAIKRTEVAATNDPVYIEYLKVVNLDDQVEKEVEQWIKEAEGFEKVGAGTSRAELAKKVTERLNEVKKAYADFIEKHPNHSESRLAYGSFLMDLQQEDEALVQMEKARELDPKNPAAWNNLANYYGHNSPVKKAFAYYERAMELDPKEPVYPWNFATTIYLFRKDAQEFYRINEQQVFDRAMELYRTAQKLDPTNLVLATDLAQTYYGIRPTRTNDALVAWNNALALAKTSLEQQGIYLHLARVELNAGMWEEARQHLGLVTETSLQDLRKRLEKNWIQKRDKALNVTNSAEVYKTNSTAKLN
jgi:tetratricopeptide (TPR) repeat protein